MNRPIQHFPRFERWLPLLVAGLALGVYLNSFPGSFFLDDQTIAFENPVLTAFDLRTIFTSDYWGPDSNSGLYRPLTILTLALNLSLLGAEPWGFHLVNVLLHVTASVLLGCWLAGCGIDRRMAWSAAALFAVHPLHVDVVNMAVGRSELLVAVLLFAAGCASRQDAWPNRMAVVACFGLALLSKEHAIVLLALLPALDGFLAERPLQRWRQRMPLYALLTATALAWLLFRTYGIERHGVPADTFDPVYVPLAFLSTWVRLLTACKLQLLYLVKLLVPTGLQPIYSGPGFFQPVHGLLTPWGGLIVAALLLLCAALYFGWRRRSVAGLALLLYLISFSPTANILFVTGATFADRLAYLPSAWFCLALPALLFEVRRIFPTRVAVAGIVLMVCAYGLLSAQRNRDYRNPLTLWQATVATDPLNVLAWSLLGNAYVVEGDLQLAEASYRKALRLSPDFADGLNVYAHMLYAQGRYAEAAAKAKRATEVAKSPFASAYIQYAKAMMQLQNWDEVLNAVEQLPDYIKRIEPIYWELRGRALEALGNGQGALAAYQEEFRMQPARESDVLLRIGGLQIGFEQLTQAEQTFRTALAKGETPVGWNGLGVALGVQGRHAEAVQAFAHAVRLEPASFEYRRNYEFALKQAGIQPPEQGRPGPAAAPRRE